MISDQRPVVQSEENLSTRSTNRENNCSTPSRAANQTSTTTQVEQKPVLEQNNDEIKPVENRVNPSLARLLIGGLVGATVGVIAGALTNRKTSQGLKHAGRGLDRASKTIGEGLSHAASGVVDATKSVGEGVGYAVSGSTQDAVQGIAEGTRQVQTVAAGAAQTTAKQLNRTVNGISESAQQAKTATLEAVQSTTERVGRVVHKAADTVEATAKKTDESVQQAIAQVPQTKEQATDQPCIDAEIDAELMNALQESSVVADVDDELDVELINALQEDEDYSSNFFIPMEETASNGVEDEIQDYVFADVEVSRPNE